MPTEQETLDEILELAATQFKVPREKLSPDDDFFKDTRPLLPKVEQELQRVERGHWPQTRPEPVPGRKPRRRPAPPSPTTQAARAAVRHPALSSRSAP